MHEANGKTKTPSYGQELRRGFHALANQAGQSFLGGRERTKGYHPKHNHRFTLRQHIADMIIPFASLIDQFKIRFA